MGEIVRDRFMVFLLLPFVPGYAAGLPVSKTLVAVELTKTPHRGKSMTKN
jgi:hypothetical protein